MSKARNPIFGLTGAGRSSSRRGGANTRFTGRRGGSSFRGGRGGGQDAGSRILDRTEDGTAAQERMEEVKIWDEIDEKMGFWRFESGKAGGEEREGWLVNMHQTLLASESHPSGFAAVDYYFIQDDGSQFKATIPFEPYFFLGCRVGTETIVEEWLLKRFEGLLVRVERQQKWDLKVPNHLLSKPASFIRLYFHNTADLLAVRREVSPLAIENSAKLSAVDAYAEVVSAEAAMNVMFEDEDGAQAAWGAESSTKTKGSEREPSECIVDIREHDINYYQRVAIDLDVRVGLWYTIKSEAGHTSLTRLASRVKRAEPVVMAYDIETSKQPLKFPDQLTDQIMMISYMIDGHGYLITNREIVSEDIEDFEYTPKDEYEGEFTIFNEPDEPALIRRWFEHIRDSKPTVMATYNGDSFDFPFVEARATIHGINMYAETGFMKDKEDEYKSRTCAHMDCFRWVKRDSYLPQGSQGLKAVTKAKLGYNPAELDPELMTPYAIEQPHILAQYSVSDAVATYYLYMKYVHPFVFSLCNIIPLNPDEVLRKGSGTLCETLLMVEAYQGNIIMPNRHEDAHGTTYNGHLLAAETYVGGHVEALEAGVFRSDIATDFKIVPSAIQSLIDDLDAALKFSLIEEGKISLDDVANYEEIKAEIQTALEVMRDNPLRQDKPLIYHLDVAAMYPNIMLSNRLQPDSVKEEAACAVCDYNRPDKTCDRKMVWSWRGDYFPAKRDEYNMVKHALDQEMFPARFPNGPKRRFQDLPPSEQSGLIHKRLGDYSRKVYRKTHETKVVEREAIICQRENPFYIDTVRAFRDRRYEYKGLHKTWKKNLDTAVSANSSIGEVDEAKKMIVLYDSLQLAHKCILNSFYGYVMRKGARWYSMEMAGITCLTGAKIIQMARQLVEQIGRPLELDTDGIWCMLPGVFPEDFTFKLKNGKKFGISYPCTMLNHLVHAQFTNEQYHDLVDKTSGRYEVRKENSIFFELDGPYKAMILPSSKEEDKLLKKRYAVFNHDNTLAELKGFEVKRRGELQLIKIFQSQIFDKFLLGTTTEECYAAVAEVANQWLDILQSRASSLHDDELVELIAENRSMSKTLAEYGSQKSTSISTAKRLAEFLGEQMVKDKGLACKFIISAKPMGAPVTERAVPVAIFTAEDSVKRHYLRKWLKDGALTDFDLRSILDWNYYEERLGSVIQKLITIPAALQKVSNPVPRVRHPDWLFKRVAAKEDKFQQHKLTDMFSALKQAPAQGEDLEDFGLSAKISKYGKRVATVSRKRAMIEEPEVEEIAPDPCEDYPGWLRVTKKLWRRQRALRSKQGKSAIAPTRPMQGNISAVLRQQSFGMSSRQWDVIQIAPTARPGEYKLWLAIDNSFQSVKLRIPREFYLNFKEAPKPITFNHNYEAVPIVRTLPRNHPCRHLYRFTVDEQVFVDAESHFSDLINNPNVDGAYELQVPLHVRALLQFGTTCAIKSGTAGGLNRGLDRGFTLGDLEAAGPSISSRKYLNGGIGIRYLYLFHATISGRQLYGLFLPGSVARVFYVDAARNRPQVPNPARWYREGMDRMQQHRVDEGFYQYPDSLTFDVSYHGNDAAAVKAIAKELTQQRRGPTVLVVHSPLDYAHFVQKSNSFTDLPVIMSPAPVETETSAIMWVVDTTAQMIKRYLGMASWLHQRMEYAAHYDVPLGNTTTDFGTFVADIDFARRLQRQDMVLWWSIDSRPDLGGQEQDANGFSLNEDKSSPQISVRGCYTSAVLEISVSDLAINSILQSAIVNEMEGSGSGSMAFDSSSHNLDEYAKGSAHSAAMLGDAVLSTQTFAILKSMIRSWWTDQVRCHAGKIKTGAPELVVNNFWRWLSSSSSYMYDPALQRFLFGLMRKVFLQLLGEFKRLGTQVIYADFNRIFLLTSKPEARSAHAFAQYLVSAATSRELFQDMSFEVTNYWNYLAWMDVANFGGIKVSPESASDKAEPSQQDQTITMDWNIQAYLPPGIQHLFEAQVGNFIWEMYRAKCKSTDGRTPLRAIHNINAGTATPDAVEINPAKQKELNAAQASISHSLTRKLLSVVAKLKHRQAASATNPDDAELLEFPNLPGSHLSLTNPTLEFVKMVCEVFSLAKEMQTEVQILKRNLLDLCGVREFSEEAAFRNPCDALILPMVICDHCYECRNVDLCRDPDRLPLVETVKKTTVIKPPNRQTWACQMCLHEYDRSQIEGPLVEQVTRMRAAYQLQDLACLKCSQIKTDNLSPTCTCGGAFRGTVNKFDLRRKLQGILSITDYHGLELAGEYASQTLLAW